MCFWHLDLVRKICFWYLFKLNAYWLLRVHNYIIYLFVCVWVALGSRRRVSAFAERPTLQVHLHDGWFADGEKWVYSLAIGGLCANRGLRLRTASLASLRPLSPRRPLAVGSGGLRHGGLCLPHEPGRGGRRVPTGLQPHLRASLRIRRHPRRRLDPPQPRETQRVLLVKL